VAEPVSFTSLEAVPWQPWETVAFENGRWFDGEGFPRREAVYVVDGYIADAAPTRVDKRIDLSGKYVVPPVGDAHTHMFDGPFGFSGQRELYLHSGVFYAMSVTAPSTSVAKIRAQLRGSKNVDVVSALGAITGPNSHPAEIYEANALGYRTYQQQLENAWKIRQSKKMADDAYYVVESEADVEKKWNIIKERNPDIIKIYLRKSDRYAEGYKKWGAGGGISPKLLPYIISKAKGMGLRTVVAVSNAFDYRQALEAGADIVSHPPCNMSVAVPGPYFDVNTPEACLLSEREAQQSAQNGLAMVIAASEWEKDRADGPAEWEQANVGKLKAAGAALAIGSEAYGATPVPGMIAGARKGLYPALDILRWATMGTPRLIFPGRKVGCLESGCEASFLVLPADPIADMGVLRSILMRVKEGELLLPGQYAAKR
jgi:imidazolonepropionase-like amidohydrolase